MDTNLDQQDRPVSVLVVEGDEAMRRQLSELLSGAGYNVSTASSGREALHKILSDGPRIVITDLEMPEMDGLDLCGLIRAHEGVGFTYVIVMGNREGANRLIEALSVGADDFITKPCQSEELIARLRAARRLITAQIDLDNRIMMVQRLNAELAMANEKLGRIAAIDELTCLSNRRDAMVRLQEQWAFASRHGTPLACMLMDIDHFKKVNDQYGHPVGDIVLKETARVLRCGARGDEAAFRVGGEEFLILCPNSTAAMATVGAERIRGMVERNAVRIGDLVLQCRISVGVAERLAAHERPMDMLTAADEALYTAKQAGRNRVSIYVPCVSGAADPIGSQAHASDVFTRSDCLPIGNTRVMLVDHDPDLRCNCRRLLEQGGYLVIEAAGGQDALLKLERERPDVVVVASSMPVMSGLECTRRIKSRVETQSIPVIVVSAEHDQNSVRAALEAGAEEFLPRPLIAEEFLARVKSMCRWRNSQRELLDAHAARGEQVRVLVDLLDFSSAAAVAPTMDAILDLTLNTALSLLGVRIITIFLADSEGKWLAAKRSTINIPGFREGLRIPVDSAATIARVFRSGQTVFANGPEEAKPSIAHGETKLYDGLPWACAPLTAQHRVIGVLVVAGRLEKQPFTPAEFGFLEMICNSAGPAIREANLSEGETDAQNSIVLGLAKLAEHRDNDTGRHLERVSHFAVILSEQLRATNRWKEAIDDQFVDDINRAVVLHDIGKVAIPDHILLKPGRLSEEEVVIMRTHAKVGADTIRSVMSRVPGATFLKMAEEIAYAHHEWYNGGGYPRGLQGEEIPLAARIAAVADVYDALTTRRPYKPPMSTDKAISIIRELSGSQFDPTVVDALLARQDAFAALAAVLRDHAGSVDSPAQPAAEPEQPRKEPAPVPVAV